MKNIDIITAKTYETFDAATLEAMAREVFPAALVESTMQQAETQEPDDIRAALAVLVASEMHTFKEWIRLGFAVRRGGKSSFSCELWRYTDKPNKRTRADRAAAQDAERAKGHDMIADLLDPGAPDPHYYKARAALFFRSQVDPKK